MTLPTNKACEMAELKACPNPWCGSTEILRLTPPVSGAPTQPYSECRWCAACGVKGPYRPTEAEAITAWNTRAPPVTREAVLEEAANWFQWDDDGEEICDALHAEIKRQRDAGYFVGQPYLNIFASAIRALKSEPVVDQEVTLTDPPNLPPGD